MVELKPKSSQTKGRVSIVNNVISRIAGTATLEVEGVSLPNERGDLLSKKKHSKSLSKNYKWIKIIYDDKLEITVNIYVKSGYKVLEVTRNIQHKIKSEVETMTGIDVFAVNVNALGVSA